MKQAILNLKKKLLLVELPEGAKDVHINEFYFFNTRLSYQTETSLHFIETKERLLEDKIKLIGKLTDITESQFEEWVEWIEEPQYYRDYRKEGWQGDITAQESFFSYLESQKILFENKLGEFPTQQNTGLEYGMEYISKVQNWEEAESKLWGINRCWIFEIL